jgi:hypothetical protein
MAEREGLLKRLGKGFDRYVGGLLGEDISTMTPEEKAAARRSIIGVIGRGMVDPGAGSTALSNVVAARAAQRNQGEMERRQKAAEEEMTRISARLFGGAKAIEGLQPGEEPTPVTAKLIQQDPREVLRSLYGTQAGRDVMQISPELAQLAQEEATGRVVGSSIYRPISGQFNQAPSAPSMTDDMKEYRVAAAQGYTGSFMDYLRDIKGASAPRISIPGQVGQTEYEKIAGKTRFESQDAAFKAAQSAADGLVKVYDTLSVIETGQPFTGALAETELNVARIAQKIAGREDKRISDTEVLDALLGSEVFAQLGALGVGARGLDTPAEREFLRQVITGTISLNQQTLKRMTEIRANVMSKIIDRYNDRVSRGELDDYFRAMGIPKNRIEKPTRPPLQTIKEGARAVSVDGRTTAVFRNGRWINERTGQPIQ